MEKLKIITELSPWFIILCVGASAFYAWLLYSKKSPWSKKVNYTLSVFRFLLVFLICVLLMGPLIKYIKNYLEKPVVVLAIDNSESLALVYDSTRQAELRNKFSQLKSSLENENLLVDFKLLNNEITDSPEQINFNSGSTNLHALLSGISSDYENRNLSSVILFSDGIYNKGISPSYAPYSYRLHTVGLGDTIPKRDISVKNLLYNKLTFQGNKFPIIAEIHSKGFQGKPLTVVLRENGNVVEKKEVTINRDNELLQITFERTAEKKGINHFIVEIPAFTGEFSNKNNKANAYVDVIEGKEKILLIASAPHPDIKAIRSVVEAKENLEFNLYIPGINELKKGKYDLVIFHQIPDNTIPNLQPFEEILKSDPSVLFITGNRTNLTQFNQINGIIKVNGRHGQVDNVLPFYEEKFQRFQISREEMERINSFPPVQVPYGDFSLNPETDIIIYQKVGNITTVKPLLVTSHQGNQKRGVFLGEGLWEWRLHEYRETQDSRSFDKLFSNLITFLSSKEDKRKFRAYPVSNEFYISDQVLFSTEVYNDVYEKIYGQEIKLNISNESDKNKQYSYINAENAKFEVKGLEEGVYKYSAFTILNGKQEKSEGEFLIKKEILESINITADHNTLKTAARLNQGRFFNENEIADISKIISESNPKVLLHSNEEFTEVIHIPWIFFLLLFLMSVEWFTRRYSGGY
ncbi:MAG: VWA domain-containing protein [Cytophagaceae bacterium]